MDSDFMEKLTRVLSDEQTMSKIKSAAGITSAESPTGGEAGNQLQLPFADKRMAFISSLKPLLREEKRKKLDSLQSALAIASILGRRDKQ